MTRFRRILPLAGALALLAAPSATATHKPLPQLDAGKIAYDPIGHFKPGEAIPPDFGKACETVSPLLKDGLFNPSGKFNAHDISIYEVFCLPYRDQGDKSASDPLGNGGGESRHGYCAGAQPAGNIQSDPKAVGFCPNHQLEFINFFQKHMETILGDFGVTFEVYEYEQSDEDCREEHNPCIGRLPAAIVAGGDHPEQHILIGSHYDQTQTGPASVWDSQEGHAEMIRVAKIMADYWRSTGTRPSATIKFVPMDGEEDGLLGSKHYADNVIPPEGESNVRGYFNADPCAGGYPAFHYGSANRIDLGIQIGVSDEEDVKKFNENVQGSKGLVERVFDRIDDKLANRGGLDIFVSTGEAPAPGLADIGRDVFIGFEKPALFNSDWANFIALGIPIFNPTPKVTGPQQNPGTGQPEGPQSVTNPPEGLYQFHTPLDNWQQMSRYSGQDQSGNQWSEAYMKGMEFCASMLSEAMLQPEMGGAQTVDTKPVAYFTAMPNEATVGNSVTFRGGASHQFASPGKLVPKADLQLKWDFGDATKTAFGENVKHAYKRAGTYKAKLTVTNTKTNETASMELPIVVEEGSGTDTDPTGQFADIARSVPNKDAVVACQSNYAFGQINVKPAGKGLAFNFTRTSNNPVTVEVFQATKGKTKRIVKFANKTASFKWKGKKGLKKGTYFVRIAGQNQNNQVDDRFFPLRRTSKFRNAKAFTRKGACQLVSLFRLSAPAFGKSLKIGVATTENSDVEVSVVRGKKTVKRFTAKSQANRAVNFTLKGKGLKKGLYKVVLKASGGGKTKTDTLFTKKL